MVNCPQIHKSSTNLPQIPHNSPHFVSEAPPFCAPFAPSATQKRKEKRGVLTPTPKNLGVGVGRARAAAV
jgi:hypothetical protein